MSKNKKGTLGVDYFIGVFYCSCIHESGFELISLHSSLKGACKGMSDLKLQHYLEDINSINFSLSDMLLLDFLHKSKEQQIEDFENSYDASIFDSVEDYIDVMTHNQGRMSFFDNNTSTAYRYKIVFLKD